MREDTRKRLERAILLRRLRLAGVVAGVATATGAMLWLLSLDASSVRHPVAGIVEQIGPQPGGTTAPAAGQSVSVKLSDGRTAMVTTPMSEKINVGDRVTIVEMVHGTGRRSFVWR
jgi:hypothetical protein